MPFNLGVAEVLVLLVVAVLVFGGSLPDVARKVGKSLSEFKRGMNEEVRQIQAEDPPTPADWTPPPDGDDCQGLDGQ